MRRLFSTFAGGAPGAGLLLMRFAIASTLTIGLVRALANGPGVAPGIVDILGVGIGLLILLGLWTPIAAGLATVYAVWHAISSPAGTMFYILLAALSVALALLGPGAWSLDARIFGWKRVVIRDGKGRDSPPF